MVFTTQAVAAPREEFEDSIVYDCGFPLELEATGKLKAMEKKDYVLVVGQRNDFRFRNGETGESVTYRSGGVLQVVVNADGTTTIFSAGRNLILTGNASALFLVGRFNITLDEEFTRGNSPGVKRVIDICDALR
jgi:hypothetical protein